MNKKCLFIVIISVLVVVAAGICHHFFMRQQEPIKVGILHSLTGYLAVNEKPMVDSILLAIDQINEQGGILGRQLKPVVVDGKSNELDFEQGARYLVEQEKVAVIFGCWLSSARKRIIPILEKANILLVYSAQTEGLEESPNILYTGAAPNQSAIPAFTWCCYNLGKKIFLIGYNGIYSYALHEMIKNQAETLGATIVGEMYVPVGETNIPLIIDAIKKANPNVIFNTINGDTNQLLFKELRKAGISSEKVPALSLNVNEVDLASYGVEGMVGDYVVANYFQSIDRPENRTFIERFRKRYGANRVISNGMESAYDGVYLWTQAVSAADTIDIKSVRANLRKQVFDGPGSITYVDENQYTWWKVYIGNISYDGQFIVVWDSQKRIPPNPYPPYQDKQAWEGFLTNLYKEWGERWTQPLS